MQPDEYARYDALGLRGLMAAGEVTPAEVEDAARRALETANAALNGLSLPLFPRPLAHAADGPFAGVPFLLKDGGPMAAGVPFALGSRAIRHAVAGHDSDLMCRFRAAGLATLGQTTVPEMLLSFATESVRYGVTRNPWDLDRGAGGSSGGAAALVAAGAVPVAHASDGAGSIRVPASCCGLVGLKPSRGRVACGPDLGEPMFGMAAEFALTRTVRDSAHLLDAVHGPGVGDKYTAAPPHRPYADELTAEPGRLRVAVTTRAWSGVPVDAQVAAATERTARLLERMGHDVSEAAPAVDGADAVQALRAELSAIGAAFLSGPRPTDPLLLEAVSRQVIAETRGLGALELMARLDAQNRVSRAVGAFFTRFDLLVTPTLAQLPAPHGTLRYDDPLQSVAGWLEVMLGYGPFTSVFNVSGQPAVSLPLGHSAEGLPIGVQVVAGHGREDLLIQVAARLEEAAPWQERIAYAFVARPTPLACAEEPAA
ncbi:amidase [Actinoplanes palleronii]|uniref:Amidase n=1 Tax=Actinoplanes palleronii TaxID=113570 RepID=A0ABQ4BK07_9ACTN|nr:amidase family protein [Actinoplanes palleronii]GIE70585.1 amidase [Actinoplanes palleronii]